MEDKENYTLEECRRFVALTMCLSYSEANFSNEVREGDGKISRICYEILKNDLEGYVNGVPQNVRRFKFSDQNYLEKLGKDLKSAIIIER